MDVSVIIWSIISLLCFCLEMVSKILVKSVSYCFESDKYKYNSLPAYDDNDQIIVNLSSTCS